MKTHRPLFIIACLLVAGIISGQWIPYEWSCWGIIIAGIASISIFKKERIASICVMMAIFLMGSLIFHSMHWRVPDDVYWSMKQNYGQQIWIEGVVMTDPALRPMPWGEKLAFKLDVEQVNDQESSGKILVQLFSNTDISYGDRLRIKGKAHRPFEFDGGGNFSYVRFLKNERIDVIFSVKNENIPEVLAHDQGNTLISQAIKIQHYLSTEIDKYLLPNEAGLVKAMLIGERTSTPKHIRTLFEQTGTAHILAISGLHVGVIAFIVYLLLSLVALPRNIKAVVTVGLLVLYIFITGGKVSVIRSVIMIATLMLSYCFERESDSLNALGMAAICLLIINPLSVFHVSFQLSFASVLGILLIMPLLEQCWSRHKGVIKTILSTLGVSIAALLSVEGLVAYYFGIIAPISILANIVIIPLMMAVVVLGFGLLLLAPWWSFGASLVAISLKFSLNMMAACAFLFAQIPGAYVYVKDVSHWHIMAYYLSLSIIVTILTVWRQRAQGSNAIAYLL